MMKIYRAVLEYNNGDYNEYERWYKEKSSWYFDKKLAEEHLPILEQFRSCLMDRLSGNYHFECNKPFIEVENIKETLSPMALFDPDNGQLFTGFEYITYKGPHSVSNRKLILRSFPDPDWYISVYIGEEEFEIFFNDWNDNFYEVRKVYDENSDFYKYSPEIREELFGVVDTFAKSILPYFRNMHVAKQNIDDWEEERKIEMHFLFKMLQESHLTLSANTHEAITRELLSHRAEKFKSYKENLEKLISYCK